jgi:hypothetical protein
MFVQDIVLGLFRAGMCSLVLVSNMAKLLATNLVGTADTVAMLEFVLDTVLVELFLVDMCSLVPVCGMVIRLVQVLVGKSGMVLELVPFLGQKFVLDTEWEPSLVGMYSLVLE